MLYYLPQLSDDELNDLFWCETRRFIDCLDDKISADELTGIRQSIKQIMIEIENRRERPLMQFSERE